MKRLLPAIALVLSLFPAMMHAQTPEAIQGLQVIAERQYATDVSGTIDTQSEAVFLVSARVYLFDSDEDAQSTWETLVAAEAIEDDLAEADDTVVYEKFEVEDIGDRAMVISVSAQVSENETGAFRTIIIQQDAMIITVTAIAGSAETAEIADDIAIAMIEREPGSSASEYDGNGASSGGVWEMFLPADADELGDLTAYADKETRPIPE